MTTIVPTAISDQYTLETATENNFNKDLGQDEFLSLMMAQLKNQDPMKPMENGEFLGQMAQFSTVSGIEDMQTSLDAMTSTFSSGQTLQSTQLVGQEVLIESNSMSLLEDGITGGSFELENSSGEVNMDIINSAGNVIQQISLGEYAAGRHGFTWNGTDKNGDRAPPGNYTASITSQQGDDFASATVLTSRVIDSVEFGNGTNTILNTRQGESLSMADIRQIRQAVGTNSSSSEQ